MNATVELTIAPVKGFGGLSNWCMDEKKDNSAELAGMQRRHSFVSDDVVTRVLHHIDEMNLNKTDFLNRCVSLGWETAMAALEAERKRHVAELSRNVVRPGKNSRR
jgi:hypothetical protein